MDDIEMRETMKEDASYSGNSFKVEEIDHGFLRVRGNDHDLTHRAKSLTRLRREARERYEREMEYLDALQSQYDAIKAESLRRPVEEQQQHTRQRQCDPDPKDMYSSISNTDLVQRKGEEAARETFARPGLNRVDWTTFQVIENVPLREAFVIDVLEGKPFNAGNTRNRQGRSPTVREIRLSISRTLPERIRINSRPILWILETFSGEPIYDIDGSVVMTAPFRSLAFWDSGIRDLYEQLCDKYHVRSDSICESPVDVSEDIEPGTETSRENLNLDDDIETHGSEIDDDYESEADIDVLTSSPIALQHLSCLIEFMDDTTKKQQLYTERHGCRDFTFPDLWYLFKPGEQLIERQGRQAYCILGVTSPFLPSKDNPLRIHCAYVNFDGTRLGPVSKMFDIEPFEGKRTIDTLPLCPLRLSEDKDLRQTLITRGKFFLDMATAMNHMHHVGLTLDAGKKRDSEVMIDFEEVFSIPGNKAWRPNVEDLRKQFEEEAANEAYATNGYLVEGIYNESFVDFKRKARFMDSLIPNGHSSLPSVIIQPRTLDQIKGEQNGLTEEEILLMPYRVFGFVLRTREWAQLDLENLTAIRGSGEISGEMQKTMYDKLVLPPGHKEVMRSMISHHLRDKRSAQIASDCIHDKGQGLTFLLHGAPGSGKTFTAQCVADLFRKPLIRLTCGDLGSTAKEVETALEAYFVLACRWDCILLLDEADVYLAARNPGDLTRNAIVSVFLNALEYHSCILFLTTNRVSDLDEAFASRIQVSLYYPPLSLESTLKILEMNLKTLSDQFERKGHKLRLDMQIMAFAAQYWQENEKMRWNGRQIRNACQTALALAESESRGDKTETTPCSNTEIRLKQRHFKTATNTYFELKKYLKGVYGTYADERAHEQNTRATDDKPVIPNPLLSYNNRAGQFGSSSHSFPSSQQAYPPSNYAPQYQPPYQQVSHSIPYGTPVNSQLLSQQVQGPWPGMGTNTFGSHSPSGPNPASHILALMGGYTNASPAYLQTTSDKSETNAEMSRDG